MKNSTVYCLLILIFFTFTEVNIFSQEDEDPPAPGELFIYNQHPDYLKIEVYPIGTTFSGNKEYKLKSTYDDWFQYNIGGTKSSIANTGSMILDFDAPDVGDRDGQIGYGKYKIDFYVWTALGWVLGNYCYIDFGDSDYPYSPGPWSMQNDISIYYHWNHEITYYGNNPIPSDNTVKIWDQTVFNGHSKTPNKSGFKTTTSESGIWLNFPHYASDYQSPFIGHVTPQVNDVNLEVISGHAPFVDCSDFFILADYRLLKIAGNTTNAGTKFYVGSTDNNFSCGASFTSNNNSLIWIGQNTEFVTRAGSVLRLNHLSNIRFDQNSKLWMKNGSKLCINGNVRFYGPGYNGGSILLEGTVSRYCSDPNPDGLPGIAEFEDSVVVRLNTNSTWELADSTILIFKGNETKLICDSGSTIKFGKGSKLILKEGARINARYTKFVSYDSTQTWDGIYMEDYAYDTLKNCTFENAYNGLNITDNYNPFGSPSAVEISNCTFKNSSSTDLLNMVYVNNSSNVLIKGINTVKTGSGGFTSGIIAEYCPTNGVIVTDNSINYVTTGISLLQSSQYIARNTITGSTNSGTGIYLDNSNGTIEYNTVNNFQKSVYGSYSSPYMLKNNFSNAYIKNTELVSNSFPVMKPVVSGSTLRWLGGNNNITGSPTHSGISFVDCYPLMDSGYNKITVNGSDYLNGIFTMAYTTVNARINYWYDNPPESNLFDMTGGDVNYDDPFDGSSLPSTDGSELNSLGWGMYDTVFTLSLGDNSTAEDLFMQAYNEEMSQNYTDAITLYKDVVSSYKTSSYAPVSLSRIFNCLEKSGANSSAYQSIQSYYSGIKTNQSHPNESRELAEDFVIKSKVKQGNIEEAVSDYNTIYLANTSNSKGMHALVNKLCLENMIQGDNSSSGSNSSQNHKINLLSLISGEDIRTSSFTNNTAPAYFKLHQNYPNPFNPSTTIRYEIPLLRGVSEGRGVSVSFKIYDMLGREVFQYSDVKSPGSYEIRFDGSNLASGMYFYVLNAGSFTDTKKMVLLK